MSRRAPLPRLYQRLGEQLRWIAEHGGDEAGYVARYGSVHDAKHYGCGGEAIYKADTDALDVLIHQSLPRVSRRKA